MKVKDRAETQRMGGRIDSTVLLAFVLGFVCCLVAVCVVDYRIAALTQAGMRSGVAQRWSVPTSARKVYGSDVYDIGTMIDG